MSSHTDPNAKDAKALEPKQALRLIQGDRGRVIDKTKRPTINQLRSITIPPWLSRMVGLAKPSAPWTAISRDAAAPTNVFPSGFGAAAGVLHEAPPTEAPFNVQDSADPMSPASRKRTTARAIVIFGATFFSAAAVLVLLTQGSKPELNGDVEPKPAPPNAAALQAVSVAQQAAPEPPLPVATPSAARTHSGPSTTGRAPMERTAVKRPTRSTEKANSSRAPSPRSVAADDAPKGSSPAPKSTSAFDTPIHPPSE